MNNQIPHFKTHICYVSEQPMPNLLLCFEQNAKPETVILLTSSRMVKEGTYETLAQNFKKLGIKTEKKELPDSSPFMPFSNFIEEFIHNLPDEAINEYAFNITGGTKLMTIAAIRACSDKQIEMFYVDTFNNTLFLLNEKKEIPLPNVCTVKNILNGYGHRVTNSKTQKHNNGAIIKILLQQSEKCISELNKAAEKASKNNLRAENQCTNPRIISQFKSLLNECVHAGLFTIKGNTIQFKDEYSRSFCNGIWLEEHVAYALEQLKKTDKITDFESSVEVIYSDKNISNQDAEPVNELDALFARNNILYHIECKTCNMEDNKKVRTIMYKLGFLRKQIGGTFAKGILISFKKLSEKEKKHAKKDRILVIDEIDKIKNLPKTLTEIFDNEKQKNK